jgi:hypothetical protein
MLQTVIQLREELRQDPNNAALIWGLAEALNTYVAWLGEQKRALLGAVRQGLTAPITEAEEKLLR